MGGLTARVRISLALTAVLALAVVAGASAHIERASYWPDPKPDNSVSPPTSSLVQVAGLFLPDVLIEVEAVACVAG